MRKTRLSALAGLLLAAQSLAARPAMALELDTLIPAGVPGLGQPQALTVIGATRGLNQPIPITLGGLTLQPELDADVGFDTAPGAGATGSNELTATPSLVVADIPAGFGAYLQGTTQYFPTDGTQDNSGYTVAVGEAAVLPRETITIAAGIARTAETGFGLNTIAITKPLAFTAGVLAAGDKITTGMFTISPDFTYTQARFDALPQEDFWQIRGRAQITYAPGGPMRVVTLLEATQSTYQDPAFNAGSYAALAGVEEDATGLWDVRLLGGAAWRQPRTGKTILAPVIEAAATWLPSEVDDVSLSAAREIDDPDQIGAVGYTLTQGQLIYTHELRRTLDFSGDVSAAHAAYFGTRLNEDLFGASARLALHVTPAFALNLAYAFNDRQADYLRAANEHIVTLGAVWTP